MPEQTVFTQVQDKVNDLTLKLSVLRDLGKLFVDVDELCVSGCVIEDYSTVCLSLLEELEEHVCSLKKQVISFDSVVGSYDAMLHSSALQPVQ